MIVRLRDLAPYARRVSLWDRIVLLLFSAPDRCWRMPDIVDGIYADDPDGGPLNAENVIRVMMYRHRKAHMPRGWMLVTYGTSYRLVQTEPARAENRARRRVHA